jgi:uncharacterized protein (TIGR00369 family)
MSDHVPEPAVDLAPNASRFDALPPDRLEAWANFGRWPGRTLFPTLVGLEVEEIRDGYCRMRLPYRPELNQPAGVVHGGALATLVDTVVVPAVGAAYEQRPVMLTISMNLNYLAAVQEEDAIAEGWVEQRGRSTVFCRAEVRTASGRLCTTGTLVYAVRAPRDVSG